MKTAPHHHTLSSHLRQRRALEALTDHWGLPDPICPEATGSPLPLTDAQGYHLAGAIDGEGSFNIIRRQKGSAYGCLFTMGMRADDEEFVRLLRSWTGDLGRIHRSSRKPGAKVKHQRNSNPIVMWQVTILGECRRLVEILDEYPLLSKKRRDYEVWREAVDACGRHDWARTAVLFDLIREVRAYDAPDFEIPESPQLELSLLAEPA